MMTPQQGMLLSPVELMKHHTVKGLLPCFKPKTNDQFLENHMQTRHIYIIMSDLGRRNQSIWVPTSYFRLVITLIINPNPNPENFEVRKPNIPPTPARKSSIITPKPSAKPEPQVYCTKQEVKPAGNSNRTNGLITCSGHNVKRPAYLKDYVNQCSSIVLR